MRLVRFDVSTDRLETVDDVLESEGIDHVVTPEYSDEDRVLVEFPLPVQAVDELLDELRESGVDLERYSVVTSAEAVNTERYEDLEARFVEGTEQDDSVAHEEIRSTARSLLPDRFTYYAMTGLSAIVATAGLLLDAPAVVIGSMAIAPQVGAALTTAVGSVIGERQMLLDGLRTLVLGLLFAVVSATAVSWLLVQSGVFPSALDVTTVQQVSSRISPGVLSLLLGLCAGSAAGFGVATDLPLSLVGVAIAAAVVPAAAAVGVGLVWAIPVVTVGAATLLFVNTVSILLSAGATLWYLGYRPEGWESSDSLARLKQGETVRLLVTLVVLLGALALPGVAMAQHVSLETTANEVVQDTLEQPRYRELSLISVRAEFTAFGRPTGPTDVTFVVSRPADTAYPDLVTTVGERIDARTDIPVSVTVEFVDQRSYERGDAATRLRAGRPATPTQSR
jgi:uncharacterized hydrophobic protein (TIGR00341 family)